MIPAFYTTRPEWTEQIEQIGELLGRISVLEGRSARIVELRRANRIESVHSSTAIEGNNLTLAQAADLADSVPVIAPSRDVLEVENALAAYDALDTLDPWNVDDFLRAHQLLTTGLQPESGTFRTVDVEIVNPHGVVLHTGTRHAKVPRLIAELLEWGKTSTDHPLIVASAAHFLIEYIHPFRDGNGRIGRLWQTLILSRWRPVFAWLPTESLIRHDQAGYYTALQASHDPEIDAAPFIDFMFDVVIAALAQHQAQLSDNDAGTNGGTHGGRTGLDEVLALLAADPSLTVPTLATQLDRSPRTIERYLAALKASGRLRREGPTKNGQWIVSATDDR